MKTVTMLEFRRDAEGILRRVAKGERFLLSHRGRPAARLEPIASPDLSQPGRDPFLTIGEGVLSQVRREKRDTPTLTAFFMAANDVFVDTAGFLPLWDAADEHHDSAVRMQSELVLKKRRFVTTDYIVDETTTLLLVRHSHAAAADFLQSITSSESVRLEWIDSDRFQAAVSLFQRYTDKAWSFTDCVSFALMRELKIQDSFTTDHHFRQAGFTPLLKDAN